MNNFKVSCPRPDMNFEIAFTAAYRAALDNHTHPARIEATCLRAQFPAILHPVQDGDLIAGRMQMGAVGFGIQHQTGGFGYYMTEDKVVAELEFKAGSARYREDLHDMLTFWKGRNTTAIVLRNIPKAIRGAVESDQWRSQPLPASPILRMAGAYVDFDKLVRIGLVGLKAEVAARLALAERDGGDVDLLASMLDVLDLLGEVAAWYATMVRKMAADCQAGGQEVSQAGGQAGGQLAGQVDGQAGGLAARQEAGPKASQAGGQAGGQLAGQVDGQVVGQAGGQAAGQTIGQTIGRTAARRAELERMACALDTIQTAAPASLLEALQLAWLYALMAPLIEFGRLDEWAGDLYVHDLDAGRITEEQAVGLVGSFFRLIDHLDCETDGRVIVGGYGRRNTANADRFCLTAIEACRRVKEVLPQFTLRFHAGTPPAVWDAAMACIEAGRTYPLLYNDDVLVPGMMRAFGVDRGRAESYMPLGCGEIEFDHYSFGSPNGSMNTLKILELAIRGGYEPMTDQWRGPATKALVDCASYAEFLAAYRTHLDFYIEAQAVFEKYEYDITGRMHPFMMVTMLYDGCLERGKPLLAGGCAHLGGTLEMYGNVNAANALAAIRKLVFEEKTLSATELVEALDRNFVGRPAILKQLRDAPKYGNDDEFVDAIFVGLHDYLNDRIREQAPKVGLDSYLGVTINNAQNTTLGRWVGATPDGRRAGMPMANANNPAPGTDVNGLTCMLNSILKPRHDNHAGMVSNIRFTRELFSSARGKVHGLVRHYFDRGAAHAMITVVGADELRAAMADPASHRDLIVRVGGFSARFVDLKKDVQQEIFDRVSY
jgi:pyruvate-formate lyase